MAETEIITVYYFDQNNPQYSISAKQASWSKNVAVGNYEPIHSYLSFLYALRVGNLQDGKPVLPVVLQISDPARTALGEAGVSILESITKLSNEKLVAEGIVKKVEEAVSLLLDK